MSESPYQVLGTGVPRMLGRERLFDRLCGHLTKRSPDHVSVVGPRLFGKSVLLNHLASHFPQGHYAASMYWELRFETPRTDAEFRSRFAEHLKGSLAPVEPDLADYLEPDDEAVSDFLALVFEDLHSRRGRVLAVLDGFDHLLGDFGITRNLWDELRTLAQTGGLCLVTGSRARLYDLCKDEESRTSNFWQIFHDPPFRVGRFEDEDWHGFLAPFGARGIRVDGSAEKEIRNWTGGVPVLAAALADRLIAGRRGGEVISKADVDRVAGAMANEPLDSVRALWDDCPIELRSALTELSTAGSAPATDVPERRKRELSFRGFAQESRRGLRSSCGLMAAYAHRRKDEVAYLNRLFGDQDSYDDNIQGMLELRLKGIASGVDPKLAGFVREAIRNLRPDPNGAVVWMRSIAETALDLIWEAELGPDRSLPDAWKFAEIVFEGGRFPGNRGRQCGILRGITGTGQSHRVAEFVTKPTCLLVDHLHSVGNFGQHREGQEVSLPTAASFCLSAIELCERLSRELPT